MCTVLLPPGVQPTAVNKHIYTYITNQVRNKIKHESVTTATTRTTKTNVFQTHTGVPEQDANHVQQCLNSGDNLCKNKTGNARITLFAILRTPLKMDSNLTTSCGKPENKKEIPLTDIIINFMTDVLLIYRIR
jgi:hypothetical protein